MRRCDSPTRAAPFTLSLSLSLSPLPCYAHLSREKKINFNFGPRHSNRDVLIVSYIALSLAFYPCAMRVPRTFLNDSSRMMWDIPQSMSVQKYINSPFHGRALEASASPPSLTISGSLVASLSVPLSSSFPSVRRQAPRGVLLSGKKNP